jgi:hypothetical protein
VSYSHAASKVHFTKNQLQSSCMFRLLHQHQIQVGMVIMCVLRAVEAGREELVGQLSMPAACCMLLAKAQACVCSMRMACAYLLHCACIAKQGSGYV